MNTNIKIIVYFLESKTNEDKLQYTNNIINFFLFKCL